MGKTEKIQVQKEVARLVQLMDLYDLQEQANGRSQSAQIEEQRSRLEEGLGLSGATVIYSANTSGAESRKNNTLPVQEQYEGDSGLNIIKPVYDLHAKAPSLGLRMVLR